MSIFISHKREDEDKAKKLKEYLTKSQVESWLDVVDLKQQGGASLTETIIGQLNRCSHLIVVFSEHTNISMWVPFELGAAYNARKGIGTFLWYDDVRTPTPSYLSEFPMMKSDKHLDSFIALYKEDIRLNEVLAKSASVVGPRQFIDKLKSRIGQ